ncbi:MAG: metal-dependent hydrolase [Desulfobaccales bacterium]
MDPLTHVATGVALSQFVSAPSRGLAAMAAVLFALLPDLDYLLIFQDRLTYLKHHRGFSHSLIALVLFVLAGAGVGRLLGGPRWTRPMFFLGLIVLTSHLFLDWLTSYGTQLLNPPSRAKFALDWIFIIDPSLTGFLLVGAVAAWWSGSGGRLVGAAALALAGVYILLCGFFHHQALKVAHQVFRSQASEKTAVAALPQPLSLRRWLLMAAAPGEVHQVFLELPWWPGTKTPAMVTEIPVRLNPRNPPRVPSTGYRPPEALEVYRWQGAPGPVGPLSPEAQGFLNTYLAFTRFPLLIANDQGEHGVKATWLDLRFSVPGRAIPFEFTLTVDREGRLVSCQIGGARLPLGKPS